MESKVDVIVLDVVAGINLGEKVAAPATDADSFFDPIQQYCRSFSVWKIHLLMIC